MKKLWSVLLCIALILCIGGCTRRTKESPRVLHLAPEVQGGVSSQAPITSQAPVTPPAMPQESAINPFQEEVGANTPASSAQSASPPSNIAPINTTIVVDTEKDKNEGIPKDLTQVYGQKETMLEELSAAVIEAELLRLINQERATQGVEQLGMQESLRWAARIRAPEVIDSLSHTRPDGTPYYSAMDEAGFVYAGKWHGENVSYMYFTQGMYDSVTAAEKMYDSLKTSTGHYQNMLSENFLQAGIGAFVQIKDNTVQIGSAQLFAST